MYHSAPYAYALVAARAYGALLVLEDRFDPEEILALIERHRITSMYMVPTMFVRLLRLPPEVRSRYDLSSLRTYRTPPRLSTGREARDDRVVGTIVDEFYAVPRWDSSPGAPARNGSRIRARSGVPCHRVTFESSTTSDRSGR